MVRHRDASRPLPSRGGLLTWIAARRPLVCRELLLGGFVAAVLLASSGVPAAHAQSIMRTPNLNLAPRLPTISSGAAARINPVIAGPAGRNGPRIGVRGSTVVHTTPRVIPPVAVVLPSLPYVRYSHNTYPSCDTVDRSAGGECLDGKVGGDGGSGGPRRQGRNSSPRRNNPQAAANLRYIANEIIAETDDAQADDVARRHRLTRIESLNVPLLGSSFSRYRIADGRSMETVRAELVADAGVRSVQPNYRYLLQDQKSALVPSEGDPAQYALAVLRLPQAHALARGNNVTVAVIDSGIDAAHPELAGAIADSFDALGSKEGPHVHGTGIAGVIAAHARLMGGAPQAKILAIRAFGVASDGAESTSFVIVKSLDYAAAHHARIINMSFAGPKDPVVERSVAAVAAQGIILVAASGNAGPKSPPLYPAANPNVIAVSATDANDKLFSASNRGAHIAIAAPGVDIFLPAPDGKYQIVSGTSFSAAYISGVAALILERNPALKPEELRTILTKTARDLGAPGRDDLFGAGEADAYAAVSAVPQPGSVPLAASSAPPLAAAPELPTAAPIAQKVSAEQLVPSAGAIDPPAASMASDKPVGP